MLTSLETLRTRRNARIAESARMARLEYSRPTTVNPADVALSLALAEIWQDHATITID